MAPRHLNAYILPRYSLNSCACFRQLEIWAEVMGELALRSLWKLFWAMTLIAMIGIVIPFGSIKLALYAGSAHRALQKVPTNFEVWPASHAEFYGFLSADFARFPVRSFSETPPFKGRNGYRYNLMPSRLNLADTATNHEYWSWALPAAEYGQYRADEVGHRFGDRYRATLESDTTLIFWQHDYEAMIVFDPEENALYVVERPW